LVALLRVRSLPATSEPVVGDDEVSRGERQPMQRAFWPALVVVGAAVAMEFSINFWAAPLVQQRTGVPLAAAAAALSALTLGMALGRTFAAGLSSRFPLQRLIVGCFLIASTGLAALLMSASYPASLAALFCTGLGLSLLFPFAQSWALELAGSSADRAVALTALPIAIAIGTAPFVLGVLAGAVGLTGALAFGFVIALVGIAATAAVILARRAVG
jgi:predicted MFS family arabinose efflux permease